MRNMSVELKSEGIGVLILHPGHVQTEMGGTGAVLTTSQSVQGISKAYIQIWMLNFCGKVLQ